MAAHVTHATDYLRVASIDEALELVSAGGAQLVGGGTDVILHPTPSITRLVDLTDLGLDFIDNAQDGVRIGATTTLTAILEDPTLADMAGGVIPAMMRQVGSPLLRNIATIGGHLARGRLSDIVPVLLALDCSVAIQDGTHRQLLLDDFYDAGVPDAPFVIESILIPHPRPGVVASFIKFGRTGFDLAMLNGACSVTPEDGVVADARVVVGETPRLATRLPAAEEALRDQPLDAPTIAAAANAAEETVQTGSDQRASATYRRQLARVAVTRCLQEIAHRLGNDQ